MGIELKIFLKNQICNLYSSRFRLYLKISSKSHANINDTKKTQDRYTGASIRTGTTLQLLGTIIEETRKINRVINQRNGKLGRLHNSLATNFVGLKEIQEAMKVRKYAKKSFYCIR